jgi:hypothetical protein
MDERAMGMHARHETLAQDATRAARIGVSSSWAAEGRRRRTDLLLQLSVMRLELLSLLPLPLLLSDVRV